MKKKILLIFVFISIFIISFIAFKLSHKPIIIENNKTKEGISYIKDGKSKKLKEDINRLYDIVYHTEYDYLFSSKSPALWLTIIAHDNQIFL